MVVAADIEKTFFDSIQEGWGSDLLKEGKAKNAERIAISELSPFGFKAIRWGWGRGPWLVLDSWLELPDSPFSMGFTVIGYLGRDRSWKPAVWCMQYGGWYKEHVIPFLQRALAVNYSQRIFLGGRGPRQYDEGDLHYRNYPKKNEFGDFYGEEEVLENDTPAGFHWYRGMLLLPTEERR